MMDEVFVLGQGWSWWWDVLNAIWIVVMIDISW